MGKKLVASSRTYTIKSNLVVYTHRKGNDVVWWASAFGGIWRPTSSFLQIALGDSCRRKWPSLMISAQEHSFSQSPLDDVVDAFRCSSKSVQLITAEANSRQQLVSIEQPVPALVELSWEVLRVVLLAATLSDVGQRNVWIDLTRTAEAITDAQCSQLFFFP